jgi:hypothetical protein
MARREGQQVDTFPSQLYGIDSNGIVRKIAVDSTGKLVLSEDYFPYLEEGETTTKNGYYKENGNTLELWWKSTLVASYTVIPAAPVVGSPFGAWLGLWKTYSE